MKVGETNVLLIQQTFLECYFLSLFMFHEANKEFVSIKRINGYFARISKRFCCLSCKAFFKGQVSLIEIVDPEKFDGLRIF